MQVVGWKATTMILEFKGGGHFRDLHRMHAAFLGQTAALGQITAGAGGNHVFPAGPSTSGSWNDMIEGQFMSTERFGAILTREMIS